MKKASVKENNKENKENDKKNKENILKKNISLTCLLLYNKHVKEKA
eukprot:CAMPEP_0198221468 /NCGR_PEP_ID=MMETSP1445-20131203/83900_1 /TAXON_ID=36898 /ORGANISM="Pyramimonas sp., Strain CCMP2087" /LENGTH=45 /DNA_ID= /DNA_START= /DNA_END= /DNA_ORIENTATION=